MRLRKNVYISEEKICLWQIFFLIMKAHNQLLLYEIAGHGNPWAIFAVC